MSHSRPIYRKRLSETGEKVRNVLVIVWLEELEKAGKGYYDLVAFLDSIHMPSAISPIHNKDVWDSQGVLDWCSQHLDPTTGDVSLDCLDRAPYVGMTKKPHIHVLMQAASQQDANWWSELMRGLNLDVNPCRWDKCISLEGSKRYWAHMDSPDKHRYSEWEIVSIAGCDLSCLSKRDQKETEALANDVQDAIKFYRIKYYHELLDTVYELGDAELTSYVRGTHSLWCNYLRSKVQKSKDDAYMDKLRKERAALSATKRKDRK